MNERTPTPITKQTVCKGINKRGEACGAGVRPDAEWCFQHDPARAGDVAAARLKGGQNRSKPAPASPIDLSTPELQRRAIQGTIDRVRAGDEPLNTGRFVVYAVSLARPIIEDELLVARLEALEQRMGEKS